VHRTLDVHVVGGQAEAGDLGVEPHVGVGVVGARLEEERLAGGAELVLLLLLERAVQAVLDGVRRGRRVEDGDVGAQVGVGRRRLSTLGEVRQDDGGTGPGGGEDEGGQQNPQSAASGMSPAFEHGCLSGGVGGGNWGCPQWC
jgi:hypothetical protein